jgi:hypothetical protein
LLWIVSFGWIARMPCNRSETTKNKIFCRHSHCRCATITIIFRMEIPILKTISTPTIQQSAFLTRKLFHWSRNYSKDCRLQIWFVDFLELLSPHLILAPAESQKSYGEISVEYEGWSNRVTCVWPYGSSFAYFHFSRLCLLLVIRGRCVSLENWRTDANGCLARAKRTASFNGAKTLKRMFLSYRV